MRNISYGGEGDILTMIAIVAVFVLVDDDVGVNRCK